MINTTWSGCIDLINKEYAYYSLLKANSHEPHVNGQVFDLPIPIIISSAIINKTISIPGTKIVIRFPHLDHAAKWLTILTCLHVMKEDFAANHDEIQSFSAGQKLLLNGCIVEYSMEKNDPTYGYMIEYHCLSDTLDPYTRQRKKISCLRPLEKIKFQPVKTDKKLSTHNRVEDALRLLEGNVNVLDKVLNIRAFGNKSYFKRSVILISQIGEINSFLSQNRIDSGDIRSMLHWSKLDSEGNVTTIGGEKVMTTPSCIVSPSLLSALTYIQKHNNVQAVIVESTKKATREMQALNEILDKKIGVYVISDAGKIEDIKCLCEYGFKEWRWDKKALNNLCEKAVPNVLSPFSSFESSLTHYVQRSITKEVVTDELVESLIALMLDLCRRLTDDDAEIALIKHKLVGVINDISRLIREPDDQWRKRVQDTLKYVEEKYKQKREWLSKDTCAGFELIIGTVADFLGEPAQHVPKLEKLKSIVTNQPADPIKNYYFVVNNQRDVGATLDFWTKSVGADTAQITVGTFEELLLNINPNNRVRVIVCGWLNKEKIIKLLSNYASSNITFLLFSKEREWLDKRLKEIDQQEATNQHLDYFSNILPINRERIINIPVPPQTIIHEEYDIESLELDLKNTLISRYSSTGTHGNTKKVKAKYVAFSNSKISFISESHTMYRVNKILSDPDNEALESVGINGLYEGDLILFRESERDVIREMAENALAESGNKNITKTAGLWREALKAAYDSDLEDFGELYRRLREGGCTKHKATIRSWLTDENLIGPNEELDLHIIAKACPYNDLKTRMDEVVQAIKVLRNAHLQSAEHLRKIFLSKIPTMLKSESESTNLDGLVLDTNGFGIIHLIRVCEIGHEVEVDSNVVNRLFTEDN